MVGQAAERFGRYELVEKLGQGGMAEVWKAKIRGPMLADGTGFERVVVIKRILPQFAREADLVAMFMREAQLCSMLSHANIVQVHELGELDGEYYIAMEYVHGRDVHAVVNAKPKEPLPPGAACVIARDVCRALSYAYGVPDDRGKPLRVIHRDVTPSNVMLTVDGAVKLVDFGVAKALSRGSATQTNVGGIRGKLGYAAPERLLGGTVDHRTDLFAVGVLVYELLTGRRLFQGDDDEDTIERILSAEVYAPSRINSSMPPGLDAIVLRAVERDPTLRFQSGNDMADAFEPFVHQLAWGPGKLAQLVCARFPQLDPALTPTNEFGDDQAKTIVSPTRPADPTQRVTLGRTATFVRLANDMGSWATPPPESLGSICDSGAITVRGRAVERPGTTTDADEPTVAPSPERPTTKSPPRAQTPTTPMRPLRAGAPAPASGRAAATTLPQPPNPKRNRRPFVIGGSALAVLACAVAFMSTAGRPRPAELPLAAPIVPAAMPAPARSPALPEPPPIELLTAPAIPAAALEPPHVHHTKPARSRSVLNATPPLGTSAAAPDNAADFDQSAIFTGKSDPSPPPPPAVRRHASHPKHDGELLEPFGKD